MIAAVAAVVLLGLLVALCVREHHEYERVYFGIIEAAAERPVRTLDLVGRLGWRVYRVLNQVEDDGHLVSDPPVLFPEGRPYAGPRRPWRVR